MKKERETLVNERLTKKRIILKTTNAHDMALIVNHPIIKKELAVINYFKEKNYLEGYLSSKTLALLNPVFFEELGIKPADVKLVNPIDQLSHLYPL